MNRPAFTIHRSSRRLGRLLAIAALIGLGGCGTPSVLQPSTITETIPTLTARPTAIAQSSEVPSAAAYPAPSIQPRPYPVPPQPTMVSAAPTVVEPATPPLPTATP